MLILNNINKTFDLQPVLRDVNLEIDKGEIVQIAGNNGSGKTTLLKIIAGLLKSESGDVYILNKNISTKDNQYKKNTIYWGHQPMVYPNMTTIENLELFLKLRGQSVPDNIDELLDSINLLKYKKIQCYKYSQGMYQKLNLLRCIISNWNIALMDEPLNGLDKIGSQLLLDSIKKWKNKGRSVLITSHNNQALKPIITSIYKIKDYSLEKI